MSCYPCFLCCTYNLVPIPQPNRFLIYKPPRIRLVIPEEVVMQPGLTVGILVLQAERLVCAIRNLGFFFQTTPAGVVAEPQQIAVFIGHLSWHTDLITVEVAGLLLAFAFFGCPIAYLCQGFVRTTMPYVRIGGFMLATVC